jgi:biopolymer transport protein ExbD
MAGLDIAGGSKRASNHALPLVPFIDFLLCLVMFLLVTAVWSHMARLTADASVPGDVDENPPPERRTLHVSLREETFELAWREGATVVASSEVPRRPVEADGTVTYPDLVHALRREVQTLAQTSPGATSRPERAVLHATNDAPFAELSAVLDALHAPTREFVVGSTTQKVPAFSVSFAVN